ncbi:unnamed protein product [Orchesella dallaii]|uniref:Uncharacterized protein n=1 Tax=Orchesella dallaii TaxID=48710 RepID=A0ABP1Q8V7_9HEXA
MTEFVSEIAIFHISLLMFVSLIYLSFWLYFFVVYEAINSIQTIGYYILFGVCGTNILVIGPGALCILRKGITTKPILFKAIIFSFIILGLLSLFPTPLLSNLASGESTKKYLHDFFIEYGRAPYLMDYIQKAHQCCGYFDYADYYKKPVESKDTFSEPVPKSCCSELVEDCEKSSVIYKQGCFVHAGSNRPKGWVQPFQGTGFLGVLLIPLALPLFQLLPTCFLHDAIQILAQKRAKLSQDAELEVRIEETPAKSHLSRKTKTAKPVENHHLISQPASSTSTVVVSNRKGHGEASVSVVSVLLEEMDLASSKLLESEDTVSDFNQQTSDRVDREEMGSRKSAKAAAQSGAPPVLLTIKENNKKKDTEPSNKVPELLLHVPNKTGNDSNRQQDIKNEHHVRDPSGVLNNYMEPEVGHNDHHSHNHQHGQGPHDSQHPHHHLDNHIHPHGHIHPPHHHSDLANHHINEHLHDHHAHLHNHPDHHHDHHDHPHEHHDHPHEHHDHPHDHHDHPHDHHDHPHDHHDHHNHTHPGFHEVNHHHHDSAPHHTHHHENDHHNSGNHHHSHEEGHHHHAAHHH